MTVTRVGIFLQSSGKIPLQYHQRRPFDERLTGSGAGANNLEEGLIGEIHHSQRSRNSPAVSDTRGMMELRRRLKPGAPLQETASGSSTARGRGLWAVPSETSNISRSAVDLLR